MLMVFAIAANFTVIVQGLFSPLNVVEGNSMSPSIGDSDVVFTTSVEPEDIKEGDVVVFSNPLGRGESIMHRVIGFENRDGFRYAVTKGDNNPSPDPFLVPLTRIRARVGVVLPMAGLFLEFLTSPPGFVICVICPLALLFLFLLSKFYLDGCRNRKCVLAREIISAN